MKPEYEKEIKRATKKKNGPTKNHSPLTPRYNNDVNSFFTTDREGDGKVLGQRKRTRMGREDRFVSIQGRGPQKIGNTAEVGKEKGGVGWGKSK